MADEVEPAVVVAELEAEPVVQEPSVYRLLDVPYQHEPETAGLDYAGELVDDVVSPSGKRSAK